MADFDFDRVHSSLTLYQGWMDRTDRTDGTDGVRLVALHVEEGGKRTLKGPILSRFCLKED